MESEISYTKENEEEFFNKINELTDKNKFLACIEALESISQEERDYKICYQLARAYQNFAIIGEDEKETPIDIGEKFLLSSIEILEAIRKEGEHQSDWNMRMAYGYQYLRGQEEKAIPYALYWAELDPSDENALLVVEECKKEIENREKQHVLLQVHEIVELILKDYKISSMEEYWDRDHKQLDEIEEKIYWATLDYLVDQEDIIDIIEDVLADVEK